MIMFWSSAAVLLTIVLGLLLKPLVMQKTGGAAGGTDSRPKNWLGRPWLPPAMVSLLVVAGSVFLYVRSPGYQEMQRLDEGRQLAEKLAEEVDRLERELKRRGGDQSQWLELASMQMLLRRPDQAIFAYRSAERSAPIQDPKALLDFGVALAVADEPRPEELREALVLLERVLAQIPEQQIALWYAGQIKFEMADFAGAADHWQTMLGGIRGEGGEAQAVRAEVNARLAEARARMQTDLDETPAEPSADDGSVPSFTVRVRLAEALRQRLHAEDILFVYARAVQGPRMPLAIRRLPASELPLTVRLSDDDAMMPGMNLRSFSEVEIVARISAAGQASPQAGDLIGVSAPQAVTAGNRRVDLLIDRVFEP